MYDGGSAGVLQEKTPTQMPIKERLTRQKKQLEEHIKDIEKALTLLERNPDIEELTNLLGRLR